MYNGVINVYKEAGFTSHDVVAKLRGICGQKKIGHTGTLDPAAVGVLPVCLGNATKLCDLLADKEKEYVADLLLGIRTDTQDATGQVLEQKAVTVTEDQIRDVILSFQGEYAQVPPMYSALKVNGKKLYELARAGKEVERAARMVTIYEIEVLGMQLPHVKLRVRCSKGTYIRTLCDDIGKKLNCGGTMSALTRTQVGGFRAESALTLSKLQTLRDSGSLAQVIAPVDSCFPDAPSLHVKDESLKLLQNGNPFQAIQTVEGLLHTPGQWVRIYDEEEEFYGIYAYDAAKNHYKPVKMFLKE